MASEKRLIYLDHALQAVSENYRSDMPKHDLDMLVATRKRLKSLPTVDAVEVVHGRWLPDMEEFDDDPAVGIRGGVFQTGWKCSICGRSERVKEPYCNCGAKMDGDGNG